MATAVVPVGLAMTAPIQEALALPDFAFDLHAHECFRREDWVELRKSFEAVHAPYDAPAFEAERDIRAIEAEMEKIQRVMLLLDDADPDRSVKLRNCRSELTELGEELAAAHTTLIMSRARFSLELLVVA